MDNLTTTKPAAVGAVAAATAPLLAVDTYHRDPASKALFVHKDLVQVLAPWAEEAHIGPVSEQIALGDVESWAEYVGRWGGAATGSRLITWSAHGLRAVLDYHGDKEFGSESPEQRAAWVATHPFVLSTQLLAWMRLAERPRSQREAIEGLEDMAEDIFEPTPSTIMTLLRHLRASVNSKADTQYTEAGDTKVSFTRDAQVHNASEGSAELPSIITIQVPVLKGHVDEDGALVLYKLQVRLRVSVDDNARLQFRFNLPTLERTLEAVYADRVSAAKRLLPDYTILRTAD